MNEPGGYRCVCEEGSQLDVSGHVCHGEKLLKMNFGYIIVLNLFNEIAIKVCIATNQ